MDIIHLKEGSDLYGTIEDYNWKDNFVVIVNREAKDIEYKHIIHWNNIIQVTIATNLKVER